MIPGWQMAAYERLQEEIVKSAVTDLKKAIRKSKRLGAICEEQIRLEKWFLSKWGQLLSCDSGEYIIEKCHQSYKIGPDGRRSWVPDDVQKEIYLDFKKGMARKEIYKKYGVTVSQCRRIFRRVDL